MPACQSEPRWAMTSVHPAPLNGLRLADRIKRLARNAAVNQVAEHCSHSGRHAIVTAATLSSHQSLNGPSIARAAREATLGCGGEAAAKAAALVLEAQSNADAALLARA